MSAFEKFHAFVIKGLAYDLAHRSMRRKGIVQRVAKAVALAPAFNPIFDKAVVEADFGWSVHKDTRAISKWQFVTLPLVARPTTRNRERTNCNTVCNNFCDQRLAFAEKLKGPEGSLQRGILFATPLSLACWLALFSVF